MTSLFDEIQFDPVFGGIKRFACNPSGLKLEHFQYRSIKLKFVFWGTDLQGNHFRFAGFGRPVQELQFGIAGCNARGIDRASRVFADLNEQELCSIGFERNLFAHTKNKRLVQRRGGCKPFLRLGYNTQGQQHGNQNSGFHGSRLSVDFTIGMRKQMTFVHSQI